MQIPVDASTSIDAPIESVFVLSIDPRRFPSLFAGFGLVPGLTRIDVDGALAVGTVRSVHSSDGSVLREQVTVLEPPFRHAYTLSGFRAPMSWLVREGHADWRFETEGPGTRVQWQYRFVLTTVLVWPLAWILLQGFMRKAMQRCLAALTVESARRGGT